MSHERIARIANGALVVVASLAAIIDRRCIWLVVLMGVSLGFSGLVNFCGFKVILERLENLKSRSR